jgi:hypothetical protein
MEGRRVESPDLLKTLALSKCRTGRRDGSMKGNTIAKVRPMMLMGEEGEGEKVSDSWFAMQLHTHKFGRHKVRAREALALMR